MRARDKDDWHYAVKQIGDPTGGGELVFEMQLQQGGKDVSDASVAVWVGDADGKELAPRGGGSWTAEESLYDCHVGMPADIPESMKFWIIVKHGDKEVLKDSFDVAMK